MTQETIDKVIELNQNRRIAEDDIKTYASIFRIITNDERTAKTKVFDFLDEVNSMYILRHAHLSDDLWNAILATIITEWDKICREKENLLQDIKQQLAEL